METYEKSTAYHVASVHDSYELLFGEFLTVKIQTYQMKILMTWIVNMQIIQNIIVRKL